MIVVNFATGHYLKGQNRLNNSIQGNKLMLSDYSQIGSPTHSESPYEFKVHAMEYASKIDPIVLWCDASLWRVGDVSIIEKTLLDEGFWGTEAGHYAGRWTNEFSRQYFKVTEQEMHQGLGGITLFSAGFLGVNFNSEIGVKFFNEWKESGLAGCFKGSWSDHRHEMTAASIIATRMGLKYQRGGQYLSYIGPGYSPPESGSIFYLQGI